MPPSPITSRHNPRVKQAAALRNRRQRDAQGETLIYGARETLRALVCGAQASLAFVCPGMFPNEEAQLAHAELERHGIETLELSPEVFEKLAYGDRYDGVIAVCSTAQRSPADLVFSTDNPLVVVIEGVEKPGNLGAMLRTADGAGVDGVIVADPVIDLFNPNAIRASVATAFKRNVAVASTEQTIAWLSGNQFQIYAARPDATQSLWDVGLREATALVLGSEANGLTDAWNTPGVRPIGLPMLGVGDSLNVSATAAVMLYEARRQRTQP